MSRNSDKKPVNSSNGSNNHSRRNVKALKASPRYGNHRNQAPVTEDERLLRRPTQPLVSPTEPMPHEQNNNPYLDSCLKFSDCFVRETMFKKYADGFVIFHSGFCKMNQHIATLPLLQTNTATHSRVTHYNSKYWSGMLHWMRETMLPY